MYTTNRPMVLLASGARTTAQTVTKDTENKPISNACWRGVEVIINVTLDPASASITPYIEGYDPASASWFTILQGAAITGTGQTILRVHPDLTAAANLVAKDALPFDWRFRMAVADTDSMTYSVGAQLVI